MIFSVIKKRIDWQGSGAEKSLGWKKEGGGVDDTILIKHILLLFNVIYLVFRYYGIFRFFGFFRFLDKVEELVGSTADLFSVGLDDIVVLHVQIFWGLVGLDSDTVVQEPQ